MAELQWAVYQADLNPVLGSEQAGLRPVLVVSRETLNRALPVVGICPLTSLKSGRKIYSTEVLIRAGEAGLALDSLVLAHQIRTIAKERLRRRLGTIQQGSLRVAIKNALRLFLDLEAPERA